MKKTTLLLTLFTTLTLLPACSNSDKKNVQAGVGSGAGGGSGISFADLEAVEDTKQFKGSYVLDEASIKLLQREGMGREEEIALLKVKGVTPTDSNLFGFRILENGTFLADDVVVLEGAEELRDGVWVKINDTKTASIEENSLVAFVYTGSEPNLFHIFLGNEEGERLETLTSDSEYFSFMPIDGSQDLSVRLRNPITGKTYLLRAVKIN